jgi:hypothetical protein
MKRLSRKRTAIASVVAAVSLAGVAGQSVLGSSAAHALITKCSDGSPPPCIEHDPTTTTTLPNVPPWHATVSFLDQSSGFDRNVRADFSRSDLRSTPWGTASWSDAAQDEGTLTLNQAILPTGAPIGFRMGETSEPSGLLCRSTPYSAVPASGRSVHVLVGSTITKSPADLQAMADGFAGQTVSAAGATVTIHDATLVPQDGQLQLTLTGHVHKEVSVGSVDASFTYVVPFTISPSWNVADPSQVMVVYANQGNLDLNGDGITDSIKLDLGDNPEPDFRSAVQDQATAAVNSSVSSQADVQWFLTLGYTVSVRQVTVTPDGLTVLPALCKVS